MTDPCLWSLTEAADAVATGKISSRELTEACLQRIEHLHVLKLFVCSLQLSNELFAILRRQACSRHQRCLELLALVSDGLQFPCKILHEAIRIEAKATGEGVLFALRGVFCSTGTGTA